MISRVDDGLFSRLNYAPRDWVMLAVLSATLAVCGVLGVSYVTGQGWRIFDAPTVAALSASCTVLFAVALMAVDWGLYRLATRGAVSPGARSAADLAPCDPAPVPSPGSAAAPSPDSAHRSGLGAFVFDEPSSDAAASGEGFARAVRPRHRLIRVPRPRRRFERAVRLVERLTPRWSARSIFVFSLVMAVFWLPWLIANYPGGTYWDTYYQIFQSYPENHPIAIIPYEECYDNTLTDAYWCDHHPVFVTMLYGAFGMASDVLTGNWMAGVFAFVCLQGVLAIGVFTGAVAYLRERRCPVVLCFTAYAFLCVMPFVSTWALCMVKDSLFGVLYVPYLLMLFEVLRTRGASLAKPRTVALFVALGLLLCLTKKQGVYVVVPTALWAMVLLRPLGGFVASVVGEGDGAPTAVAGRAAALRPRSSDPSSGSLVFHTSSFAEPRKTGRLGHRHAPWKAFAAQALLCVVVMAIVLPFLLFPLMSVAPGGKQEVLGVLFQQTARFVKYYPEDVTDEECAVIDEVLEYDNLADQYTFNFQDEVKYRFKLDATAGELMAYMKVWFDQGMRHPESYLASLMAIAGYYVAPVGDINIRMVTVDTHMGEDDRYMLYNPDELDGLRLGLDAAYQAVAKNPITAFPFLCVTYVLWLPAALLFFAWRRRVRCGLLMVPAAVLLAFCVIAPVYDARYCVPLLFAAPLMAGMVVALVRAKGDEGAPRAVAAVE